MDRQEKLAADRLNLDNEWQHARRVGPELTNVPGKRRMPPLTGVTHNVGVGRAGHRQHLVKGFPSGAEIGDGGCPPHQCRRGTESRSNAVGVALQEGHAPVSGALSLKRHGLEPLRIGQVDGAEAIVVPVGRFDHGPRVHFVVFPQHFHCPNQQRTELQIFRGLA